MSETPYLVAHKVRGLPAFDIAIKMICPHCDGNGGVCNPCDDLGHWWIIPTSGHRAYPWWSVELDQLMLDPDFAMTGGRIHIPPMPSTLLDHYTTTRDPTNPRPRGLEALLAKARPQAQASTPIARRGF